MSVVRVQYDIDDDSVIQATRAVNELNEANDDAIESTKELGDEADDASEGMESLSDEVKGAANNIQIMGVGLGDAATRLTNVTKSTKLWGVALKALPLVAVAGALASVATFLTKTQRGQDLLQVSTAKLNAGLAVFRDRIAQAGEELLKTGTSTTKADSGLTRFFKTAVSNSPVLLSLATGVGLLASAFPELTKEIIEETEAAGLLEEQFLRNRDAQLALNVSVAQGRAEIEAQKLEAEDTTRTFEERLQAARRAFELENQLLEEQTRLAEERVTILEEQQALGENTFEDNQELAEAQIALAQIEQESLTRQIELNNKVNAIEKERIAQLESERAEVEALREAEAALAEQREAEINARLQREFDAITELAALQEEARENFVEAELIRRDRLLENEELTQAERQLIIANSEMKILSINKAAEEEKVRIAKEANDKRLREQQELLTATGTLLNAFGATGKEAAIAQATIDTFAGADKAFAQGGVFGFVTGAAIIAQGLANVATIARTDIPQFSEGVLDLKGPGTATSDSIPAMLSKGESVMTAQETRDFMPTLRAMRSGDIDHDLLNAVVTSGPQVIDATRVVETQGVHLNMDENGFTQHIISKQGSITKKQNRYRAKVMA